MTIVNPGPEDFHLHSLCFSDGLNTIDEIVQFAGRCGLRRITITDHCQAYLDARGFARKTTRTAVGRWRNVHNEVEVRFGVEADILNRHGDICDHIQGAGGDFLVLSAHNPPFADDPSTITEAYLNAIRRHAGHIGLLGHPCAVYFERWVDIDSVVRRANECGVAVEVNGANLANGKTNLANLRRLLAVADRVYVNSDAHTLHELASARERALRFVQGFVERAVAG